MIDGRGRVLSIEGQLHLMATGCPGCNAGHFEPIKSVDGAKFDLFRAALEVNQARAGLAAAEQAERSAKARAHTAALRVHDAERRLQAAVEALA